MKRFEEMKQRIRLAVSIMRGRDGDLVRHARDEFRFAGWNDGDEMNALMASNLVDLMRVFSTQGHSGFSAGYARHLFAKLADFKPLGPLTGADSEWFDHGPEMGRGRFQNKRCSHVFKDLPDGAAYDIDAVVFEEPNGARFTGFHSRRVIEFPYSPRRVIAQVPEDATDVQKAMQAEQAWKAAAA